MFKIHKIWWSDISVRNLFLLFLTIVLGFASVVTLAEINIFSDISNAWQTIGRITITSDGSDTWTTGIDMSSSGIYINSNILDEQLIFSWRVLWIDETGNLIYAFSQNIIFSWASGSTIIMWSWDDDRTIVGNDIYTTHAAGNVGIGTSSMDGKLHIQGSAETEIYIEETNASNAANINLKNAMRTRGIWGDGSPDVFYIGQVGWPLDFIITPLGYIGIWTINPQEKLEVNGGNIRITNLANQIVLGTDSNGTIVGSTSGSIYNFISWFIQIIQGNTWATGAQWPQGIQGIPWVWSWTAWATGAQWPQGNTWATWPQWPQGIQGFQWPQWIKGNTWATGAQWIQWPQGIQGNTWATGAQWIQWPQGNTWATGLLQAGILWATPFWNGSSRTTNNTNIFNTGWNVKIANMLEVSCGSYTNNKWIKIWNNSYIYDDNCWGAPGDTLHVESNDAVAIRSNNLYGVFVNTNGRVWIGGITTPAYALTVSGNSQFTNNLYISGNMWIGTTLPAYKFDVNGIGRFQNNLYVSGNIWIGTAYPSQKLVVSWTALVDKLYAGNNMWSSMAGDIHTNNGWFSTYLGKRRNESNSGGSDNYGLIISALWTSPTLYIGLRVVMQNINQRAAIFLGKVGIGVENPAAQLDINGNVKLGQNSIICDANHRWEIRYDGYCFKWCTPTWWESLNVCTAPSCWSAHNASLTTAPSGGALCSSWTASAVTTNTAPTGTQKRTWTCNLNAQTSSCRANQTINWVCDTTPYYCDVWTSQNNYCHTHPQPDNMWDHNFSWRCNGYYWWTMASCSYNTSGNPSQEWCDDQ